MSELSIITGGEPLEVEFLDGKSDTVTVRTLSLATIANELAVADGDEVAMVEIFTGTRDKPGEQRLRALRIREAKLAEQVENCALEEFEALENQLNAVRLKIDFVEQQRAQRFSARLTPESHEKILELGEKLNRPTLDRWSQRRLETLGRNKEAMTKLAQVVPEPIRNMLEGRFPSSSSPPSAASSSAAPT
jgi:hypothetical protein